MLLSLPSLLRIRMLYFIRIKCVCQIIWRVPEGNRYYDLSAGITYNCSDIHLAVVCKSPVIVGSQRGALGSYLF